MKIFIISEYNNTSGGPETLHQICNILRNNGYESYVYYIDDIKKQVPDKFKKYNVEIAERIEDDKDNILLVPETCTEYLYCYKNIRKGIIWLSLNHYLENLWSNRTKLFLKKYRLPLLFFPIVFVYLLLGKKLKKHVFKDFSDDKIYHSYNCEYINMFLNKQKVRNNRKRYICGPLRDEFFINYDEVQRKNQVLYNPKKGYEYTKRIINANKNKDICFIPIQGLKTSQIIDLMRESKVYIDFGYFPGPERIPREAAMMKLNLITSVEGSAKNDIDVMIPSKYKFEKNNKNIEKILTLINDMTENYKNYSEDFNEYRKKIISQKNLFENNVLNFIEMIRKGSF